MEKILNLNTNVISHFLNKNDTESKEYFRLKPKMPKLNTISTIILVVLSIISVVLYTYGVYLAFFCSKNLINLLSNLIVSLLLPHLNLIYRLARPCNEMLWLTKRTAIILTIILLIVIPIIMLLLPKKLKLYLALALGGNSIIGSTYNYSLWSILMIPFALLIIILFTF